MATTLSNRARKKMWLMGQGTCYLFGSIFQNSHPITVEMIDEELKVVENNQKYIDAYRVKLSELRHKIGENDGTS